LSPKELREDQLPEKRRVALLLEYDGTRYAGSQLQSNAPTIQGEIEAAIVEVTQEQVRIALAGRTDAGVHALGQVAAFDIGTKVEPAILWRALNAVLPKDVVARDLREVEAGFDPRRQAVRRHYRYAIDNGPIRPAIGRERVWHVGGRLDVDAMAAAAALIAGEHDFAAFASPLEDRDASTVRNLECLKVKRRGRTVLVDAVANAFLPHQVRRMVGCLVEVGRGRLSAEGYGALLVGPPASAGPAAPARGLTLVAVEYSRPLFENVDSDATVC
jgi:tRNA pseudouridine38-40 synthase